MITSKSNSNGSALLTSYLFWWPRSKGIWTMHISSAAAVAAANTSDERSRFEISNDIAQFIKSPFQSESGCCCGEWYLPRFFLCAKMEGYCSMTWMKYFIPMALLCIKELILVKNARPMYFMGKCYFKLNVFAANLICFIPRKPLYQIYSLSSPMCVCFFSYRWFFFILSMKLCLVCFSGGI